MQLITVVLCACVASITLACRCSLTSTEEKVAAADFYIRADVEAEYNITISTNNYHQYDISIRNIFKWNATYGSVDENTLITTTHSSSCGGRLTAGARYKLAGTFYDSVGDSRREMFLGLCKIVIKET